MAFALSGLYQVGPAGAAPRLWMYSSADAIADVNTAGYFNNASHVLSVRDVIFVVDTETPSTNIVSVLSNAAGVVDVSNGLAITETDSD
jgi:hypothetical protein